MPPAWEPISGRPQDIEASESRRLEPSATHTRLAIAAALLVVAFLIPLGVAQSFTLTPFSVAGTAVIGLAILGLSGAMLDRGNAPWNRTPLG
jgi:hypothetical protein